MTQTPKTQSKTTALLLLLAGLALAPTASAECSAQGIGQPSAFDRAQDCTDLAAQETQGAIATANGLVQEGIVAANGEAQEAIATANWAAQLALATASATVSDAAREAGRIASESAATAFATVGQTASTARTESERAQHLAIAVRDAALALPAYLSCLLIDPEPESCVSPLPQP